MFLKECRNYAASGVSQTPNFSKIMKGNYSKLTKLTCLLSQSKSRPAMWIGYYANKLSQKVKDRKNRMFE